MSVKVQLRNLADPKRVKVSQSFFKTGPGEYGEGDIFWGIKVPTIRAVAKRNKATDLKEVKALLHDQVHECRTCALMILLEQYKNAAEDGKERIIAFYIENKSQVNNWDLVDGSAPYMLGDFLLARNRSPLYELAGSSDLWSRRIAIVATYAFIRKDDFKDTLALCERLMQDKEDLLHKACGWMLREVGKRDESVLREFLNRHAKSMPRTMLRYAIERLGKAERKEYLARR